MIRLTVVNTKCGVNYAERVWEILGYSSRFCCGGKDTRPLRCAALVQASKTLPVFENTSEKFGTYQNTQ
jgi:hypothetical protein